MPKLREKLAAASNVIIESNSIMGFLQPDLYLSVLDPRTADFKASALKFLKSADAVVLHEAAAGGEFGGKRVFRVQPPQYVTEEIVGWVRGQIAAVPAEPAAR